MSEPAFMRAERITKRFGSFTALRKVSLDLMAGEVHAICGENGAGKSTLIKVLGGLHAQSTFEGGIWLRGRRVDFRSVRDAERNGIVVVHQELALIDSASVAENLLMPRLPRCGLRVDWHELHAQAHLLLKRFSLPLMTRQRVGQLGVGEQQLVEIVRGLAKRPRVLILDEPTAALSSNEVDRLFDIVNSLRDDGVSIIYISHKLDEVLSIADRVTVLRDGVLISTDESKAVREEQLIRRMVGRKLSRQYPPRPAFRPGECLIEINCLSVVGIHGTRALDGISFSVREGEIVGLAGLMGAGRSELLMHLFGLWGRRVGGQVRVSGRSYSCPNPAESIRRGLMLVTEDRKRLGLSPFESGRRNLSLSSLNRVSRWNGIAHTAEQQRCARMSDRLRLAKRALDAPVCELSGGNQQKVVVGRGLLTEPRVVLLDEPMRGIDVGAKREVFEVIRQLASNGKAILLASSELPEITEICDRIVVMREGRVAAHFDRRPFAHDAIMAAAAIDKDRERALQAGGKD